jgi:WD40 repeat protein
MLAIRDASDGALIARNSLPEFISSVAFSPTRGDGSGWLAAGDRSGTVRLLPVDPEHAASGIQAAGRESDRGRQWSAHRGAVYSAVFSADGRYLYTSGDDGRLVRWDLAPPEFHREISIPVEDFVALDDSRFVVAGNNLSICDAATGAVLQILPGTERRWRYVAYARRAQRIFALDETGTIYSHSLSDPRPTIVRRPGPDERVGNFSVSPDGLSLAVSLRLPGNRIAVELWRGGETLSRLDCDVVHTIVFSPDGRTIAFNHSMNIQLLDATTGKAGATIPAHSSTINRLAFSSDGKLLVSVSDDRTVKVWDCESNENLWQKVSHEGFVECVAISPDGLSIATAGVDGSLRLWRWQLDRPSLEVPLVAWPVHKLAFTSDGQQIIAAEETGIRIYGSHPFAHQARENGQKNEEAFVTENLDKSP